MLRVVGVDRLVLGSDRPVAEPPALASLGEAVLHAIARVEPGRRPRSMTHSRDLDQPELERLVQDLAAQPERWRHLVNHRPDERTYAELHRDEHVAIWLICWMNDHDTGYHDHDLSAGAVAVTQGAVREERLVLGGAPAARTANAGEAFTFGPADIHRVSHAGARAGGDDPRLLAAAVADGRLRGPADRRAAALVALLRRRAQAHRGIEKGLLAKKLSPGRGRRGESGSRAGPVA